MEPGSAVLLTKGEVMNLKIKKNVEYGIACPTSMGVRITPTDRQQVQTSHMF